MFEFFRKLRRPLSRGQAELVQVLGAAGRRSPPLRLLVFADAAGATLQLNLLRPLARALQTGACRIHLITEASETAWRNELRGDADAALDALWVRAQPSAVLASRYGGSLAGALAAAARRHRTPLAYHLDDNLFEVPPEAGVEKARRYGSPERQAAMRLLLRQADVVYLSTDRLCAQLEERGIVRPGALVGPIASASDPLPPTAPRPGDAPPLFGYMASSSHGPDLELALPGVQAALERFPGARFEIYGTLAVPPSLARFGDRVRHHGPLGDYDAFLARLRDLAWDWGIAPLRQGRFNEAKTNTKWVEYAAAGIPAMVSRHPIYEDCCTDGSALAIPDDGWHDRLPAALLDRALRQSVLDQARERLIAAHGIARLAGQIETVLRSAGVAADVAAAASRDHG